MKPTTIKHIFGWIHIITSIAFALYIPFSHPELTCIQIILQFPIALVLLAWMAGFGYYLVKFETAK